MKFDPYNSVSTRVLKEVVDTIAKLEQSNDLQQTVITKFMKYFSDAPLKDPLPDFSIETSDLLGTSGAVILVDFNEDPFTGELKRSIGAITLMLPTTVSVPVIYFADDYKYHIEHEKVHACQYLLESKYPFSDNEVKLFFTNNLRKGVQHLIKSESKDKAFRFLSNAICYKMWMEFEAVYNTQETEYWPCLAHAFRCAGPFDTFNTCWYSEIDPDSLQEWNDEMLNKVTEKFSNFCNEMENHVKWIRFIRKGRNNSLYDDIVIVYNKLTEQMQSADSNPGFSA